MPVYVYVCVCASISASKKSDLNIVSQKSQLKHLTKGSWRLWDGPYNRSWSIQHLAQELRAAREAFGTAAPQADGAASCGTQHELKTCVGPRESQTNKVPCPTIRKNEGGGQEEELKHSSGEGRGDPREMRDCSDE